MLDTYVVFVGFEQCAAEEFEVTACNTRCRTKVGEYTSEKGQDSLKQKATAGDPPVGISIIFHVLHRMITICLVLVRQIGY